MIRNPFIFLLFTLAVGIVSCQDKPKVLTVSVTNTLNFQRNEIVGLPREKVELLFRDSDEGNILIKEKSTGEYQVLQWIDNDMDGNNDELLFQASVDASSQKEYEVLWLENATELQPETDIDTYSRFIPERTDDYAWENDRVAFRTYGPEAQRLVEAGEPGGTLSSGIDLWLKRVNYSIIDKWYAENTKAPGYYHIDHGEGYDPYHVGKSRGTGGIGIWQGDSLLTSKNFTAYRKIATGPLRTVFELDYAAWSEFGVSETKRISLDLGANFSKFEIALSAQQEVPNYTIGITLHEGNGKVITDKEEGLFSHIEQIDSTLLCEGIVIDATKVIDSKAHKSATPDQSQLLILTDPKQDTLVYYAGFAWEKSKQIDSEEDWLQMLQKQALIAARPLQVEIVTK